MQDGHGESADPDLVLDASGLRCPLPLLKAKQALNGMTSGQCLAVTCTDPGSLRDFEVFCRQSGHGLLRAEQTETSYFYLIRKK